MSRYQKVLAVLFCMLILFAVAPTGGAYAQTEGPFGDPTCSDLIDNDGDGKKDAADTDCYNIVGDPAVDDDGDGRTENDGDCNDDDPTVYAGAQKICDGKDNNCDGKKDFTTDEDKDNDGVPWCAGDCDDNNPNRAPNILEAPEGSPVCTDGIDNDCDNKADSVDPGCQFSCFDSDGDGYGINGDPSCTGTGIDCNDNDATVNPGVTDDSCNGVDNNCSTVIDDEYVIDTLCGTGECQANNTPSSCVAGVETLCQPGTPVYEGPQGDGTCSGGLDEDCDNLIDGNDPGCNTLCIDQDGDGYGSNGHASCPNGPAVDCDDTNAAVNPAGDDANCNGIDEDCAGGADDGYVPDALCGTGLCQTTNTPGSCTGGVETACQPGTPVAEDTPGVGVCTDGVDNDCDGLTDAADSEGCSSLDVDDDGDGYTENQNDCNDGDPTMYPGAPKICDGKDNNCDGKRDFTTDEDKDLDGVPWCAQDCDDNNPNRAPNIFEGGFGSAVCTDGIDNDCDNRIDFADLPCQGDCIDTDGDGYGVNGDTSCDIPGEIDCDDTNAAVNPAGDDANCNGIDEDCVGGADSGYVSDTLCGTGECQANNTPSSCTGGVETACQPGAPVLEGPQGDPTCIGGLDEDCDDLIDGNDPGCNTLCIDQDGDGYGSNGHASCPNGPAVDCDDSNAAAYPGGDDANCNGIDEDCVGGADSGYVVDASCGTGLCNTTNIPSSCTGGVETLCQEGTPGDENVTIADTCTDGVDNDCDGSTDAVDSDCSTAEIDNDGDGYCRAAACTDGSSPNDCDDTDPNVYPGAPKICDGKDSNCDGKKDSPTDEDKDLDGVPWCAGDCDDNDPLAYPGNTEGPFGDPTCSDGRDNDCQNGADTVDPVCVVSCETGNDTKDGLHVETMRAPGPDGIPNTADDIDHPESSNLLCGKCHGATLQDPIRYACDRCHEAGGTSKAAYPDPWPFGFGSAPDVMVHSSTVVGTKYGAWDMDCLTCHNPHFQEQDEAFGTSYGKYIKEYICFDNPVTGLNIEEIIEFTSASGAGSFADGPPYNENICNMCHTQTNHHRRADAPPAPGGQDHNNGQDCAGCHPHIDGFAPSGGVAAAPHDTGRFLSECDLCHVSLTDFTTPVPDAKCEQCHTPSGLEKPNFPTAPNVLTHADFNNPGSAYTYTNACIDCHDPMFNSGAPNQDLIRSTIAGSVLGGVIDFTAYSGPGSFADGPPYPDNICNTCHSMTNHHRADTSLPLAEQDHNNESDCRGCHAHNNAFIPDIAVAPPHDAITDCGLCHTGPNFSDPVPNIACESCHTATGLNKGSYPTAPNVVTHQSRDCIECHDPMFDSGSPNFDLIRSTIAGSITPGSIITFTSYTGINSFGNGPPYSENICDTCHSATDHHQSDGDAPGGQQHENGSDCRSCHDHNDPAGAWAPPAIMAAAPHNMITDCNLCHVGGRFSNPVPNSQCANCHTPTGSAKGSYPTAPNVNTHMGRNCIECHDPMYASTLNFDIVRETIAGSIVPGSTVTFTAYSGAGSFADGPLYNENICETCHSATNHHQSDGVIDPPNTGPQDHENNSDCRTCHDHNDAVNAFAAPVIPVSAPHDAVMDCYACHMGYFADPIPDSQCEQCHTPAGALKGSYPTAPNVLTHTGNTYGLFSITCIECHNPMDDQTNRKHVRSTIAGSITPGSTIVFTSQTLAGSFADGPPYNENVCDTCHSMTNHHQSDGTAPGGQDHENGSNCTVCHAHDNSFQPGAIVVSAPHDVIADCTLCHVGANFSDPIPNTACESCHTPTGVNKGSYPTAPDVLTHMGGMCIECHDPMNDQTNINHVRSTIAGSIVPGSSIVFTTRTMTGSFADGPPYNENVCNTCHSATNHHQSDGVIDPPSTGPQDHENGSDCTTCHDHNGPLNAFATPVIPVSAPHDAVTDCYACHMGNFADSIPNSQCEQCHTPAGALKGSYPTAPNVLTHMGGTCVECHNPMDDQANINHVLSTIAGSIVPGSNIVFTSRTLTGSFADGPPYNENVCNTCHSATNHHQSDGVIDPPNTGPQDHENGSDCTTCHDHNGPVNAFAAPNIIADAPHNVIADCYACHMGNFADAIPNSQCEQCHTAGGVLKGSYPTAPDVATHAGSSYGPFTRDCVDCHNPMDPQTNQKHVRTDMVLAGGGVNVVYPPFVVGAAPWNGVCETCHTQTNHHQNDGIIDPPNTGTQAHNNAATCTDCHPHLDGFLPTGSNVPMPHDAQLCNTCHVAEPDYAAVIPDSACLTCHDELASPSGNLYQVDNFVGLTTGAAGRPIFGNWTGVAGSDGTNGWMVWTGPTNSAGTGPSAGNPVEYVVLESSASSGGADADPTNGVNVTAGSAQYLVSNVIDASMYAVRFAFDWNMNVGNNTDASLHLDAWNGTAWDLDVTGGPINIGNNGDIWVTEGPIDLSAYSNVDFQLRIRYIVGTGTTYQNDVAVDNLVVLGAGGGAGSDLKVMTHADTVNPPRPYTYSNTCVGCHNPMYPQQNLAFIRQTIAGSVLGGTIDFTAYMGAGSFADGPPYPDNICNTCHLNTQHHQADGIAPGGQDHNNGQDCGQCHPHLEGFQPQGGCTVCHSQSPPIGSSDPNRRQIVQNAGDGQGDFVKTSHHVTDGTTTEIVTDDSCIVCHDQSSHQSFGDGQSVLLNDQDGGASYTYDGTGASIEGFCVSCHDTDGSLLNGSQPFIASGDTNSPPDVGWSAGVVSHSTFDVCFNCHAQGHGSDFEKILAEDNEPGLCFNCHDADGPASTDIDFRFAQQFGHPVTAANSSIQCLDCHNPHQAEPGTHTPDGQWYPSSPDADTNLVSGVLSGVMGVEPSPWAPAWTKTDSYTVLDSAEKEYQICFKCHARYSHQYSQDCFMCHPMTWDPDLGAVVAGFKFRSAQREFNINNKSAHPVAVTSNNQSGSYAPKALSTSQMEAPWTNVGNQTMYCSDCHGSENEDGGDPRGPHGSGKPFMLKGPNTMWPAGSVRLFSLNDISGDSSTESLNTNWRNEIFCLNCHDSFPSSNRDSWQNEVHIEHDDRDYEPTGGNKRNVYCIACHAIVPHGSHVSRLITYRTELPEYNTYNDVNYNVIEGFRKTSRFSYDKDDCRTVTNLGCDKHDDRVNNWD